ncbi:MAG: tetratricopeptide repeat protein [bacterium]|nr:tetratricopeptide repeat protein [bacterium]
MVKDFEIDAYRKERELFVILRGRLVLQYCQEAKTRLTSLFNTKVDQLYLYLAELSFLDSAGLGVLVGLKMSANKNHTRLAFLAAPSRIADVFRVSKLDTIFEVRAGAEADLVRTALQRDEYCLWRDSKDISQRNFNTEVSYEPLPQSNVTQVDEPEAQDNESQQKVKQWCIDAVEFIKQGDYHKAIDYYQRALDMEPGNLTALNNLGIVYEKRPEWYPQARETWNKVLEYSLQSSDEKHATRARKHIEALAKLSSI